MKYTSAQANKLLKSLNSERNMIISQEDLSRSFVASINEDPEKIRPQYDFQETRKQLEEVERKIRLVKHALNVFNSTTVIEGMTIDEALVYIPQLTARKQKLEMMQNVLPIQRQSSYGTNIIDYVYANYDVELAKAEYVKTEAELTKIQLALDTVNNSEDYLIEIDL